MQSLPVRSFVRGSWALALAIIAGLAIAVRADDIQVVVPGFLESVDAVSGNKVPFSFPPARYQQLNLAAEFDEISGPTLITQVAFRLDKTGAVFTHTILDMQLNLSTAAVTPLSSGYDTNVGSDDTMVYDGELTISANSAPGSVRPFEIVIPLQTPFGYDPSAGDLLLDLRMIDNTDGGVVPFIDSYTVPATLARVFCQTGCDPDDSGGSIDGGFLVTRFTFAPEPSSALAGAVAMLALGLVARARACPS